MRLPALINSRALSASNKNADTQGIITGKVVFCLLLTMITFVCLFHNLTDHFSRFLFYTFHSISLAAVSWIVLVFGILALWLARNSIWQSMQVENKDFKIAITGFIGRMLGLDMILAALLILIAYPLPPAPSFLIFRLLTAFLAAFVLVFGRKAALAPSVVIGIYGISLLFLPVLAGLMA
jgi:hypothetical protein